MPRALRLAASTCSAIAILMLPAPARRPIASPASGILVNDNRHPAGHLHAGVLTLRLEAGVGTWRPEGPDGARLSVAAFGETGGPLQNPGPLVRVPSGTEIRATVHNALTVPLWIYGMGTARGYGADSFDVAPGATRELRFRPTDPGVYYYSGRTTHGPVFGRSADDSQLNGVIVVDPAGTAAAPDRIFVISTWFTVDSTSRSGLGPDPTLAFNGLSWPHTESLTAAQGDSLHWRFVNVTPFEHPLHLHGFYFRVDAKGDGVRDTIYAPADRRLGVTEVVLPNQTMSLTWAPTRAGNWIFHCHFASHIASAAALEADRRMPVIAAGTQQHSMTMPALGAHGNPMHHNMAGLVLGIRVSPKGPQNVPSGVARPIRLIIRSRASVYGDYTGYSYVLGGSPAEADPTAMPVPGPTLELRRGQLVAITIINRSHENAAIHWHGIELQSFPDGVAGWSGNGKQTLPMVAPGDSLTVRFVPPRAGTFMYHSHSNEFQQIGSGLYGAIVVTDSARPDPATDRVLLFSDDGPTINFFRPPPPALLNGRPLADTLTLKPGVPQRLRLINIRTDYILGLGLVAGGRPLQWRELAKDGADLPAARTGARPAYVVLAPGEIMDVEVTPPSDGSASLSVTLPTSPPSEPTLVPIALR